MDMLYTTYGLVPKRFRAWAELGNGLSALPAVQSARELHVFCTPAAEEIAWARENASSDTGAPQLTGPP
jgi:hypothetical protein